MNIPIISTSLLKRHERVIGPAIEAVASESFEKAIKLEIELTEKYNNIKECARLQL